MLSRWKPINSLLTSKNKENPQIPPKALLETTEHREHRLCQQYEESLMLHRQNQTIPAKRAFEQISQDLYQTETNRWSITQEHIKRHKKDDTPLWERHLRYAVNRNLAEVYEKLEDYPHAVTAYSNALSDDPSDFLVWIRAGRSAAFSGHLHIARKALEIAKTFRPNHWLYERVYKDVLDVIGDADEDVNNSSAIPNDLSQSVMHIVQCRQNTLEKEIEKFNADPLRQPQLIQLDQLSWDALVSALLTCFKQRITGTSEAGFYNVGHAIAFELPQSFLDSGMNSPLSNFSDEIQFVSEIPVKNAEQFGQNEDVIVIRDDDSPLQKHVYKSEIKATEREGTSTNSTTNVKQPNTLVDAEERSMPAEEKKSDEKALTSQHSPIDESMHPKDDAQKQTPVNHSDDDKTHPEEPVDKKPTVNTQGTEKVSAGAKKQDLRRSSRQRAQNEQSQIEKDKRQTRNATELRDIFQLDSDLIQALVDISLDESYVKSHVDSLTNDGKQKESMENDDDDINLPFDNRKECAWTKVLDNLEEARDVKNYIDSFKHCNSGPADLLLRILQHLSDSSTTQFSSTLATLWSSVKDNLQLHLPGSPSSTALIAEAMLSSGKKVGKAKAQRFQEAARLLSHVKFYDLDSVSTRFLKIRLAWVWSQLHEYRGEMRHSFESAELALKLANDEKDDSVQMAPDIAGPDLAGYSVIDVRSIIAHRLSRLKTARDLEKAEEELQKMRAGDGDAANRIIAILGSSVRSSVREIGLHKWDPDGLKTDFDTIEELEKWENRFDAEVEFEPRLLIFEEACIKSDDLIGSLACFSFRLRMTVHYYTAQIKCEQEKEYQIGPDEDSSAKRLTDLLFQVRKFVFVIKKISSSTDKSLWNKKREANKWSMSEAASAAIVTLISLTQLLITKVPAVKGLAQSTELSTGLKNVRLGFSRCMLAFPRCIMIRQKCDVAAYNNGVDHESEDGLTVKLLYITSFCLKALASRGCCRSEGTSGALIKLYISLLLKRLQELAMCDDRINENNKKNPPSPGADKEDENMLDEEEEANSELEKSVENSDDDQSSVASTDSGVIKVQPEYPWSNTEAIRHELSQCFDCLYLVQEFESVSNETKSLKRGKWLKKGCEISRKMGLAFTNGDPNSTVANLDVDVCANVYLFYRKKIFEAVYLPRRDGGRIKRVLEMLSLLVENLSLDPPEKVPSLRRDRLDSILNDTTLAKSENPNETSKRVKQLADHWNEIDSLKKQDELSINGRIVNLQYSILYFELFILHTYSLLSAHDSEYKKQKSAERRKRPKEVAERLLTASLECMAALRVRPWSVGAWILLGRVFTEIIDLALDERELVLSSFGLYRPDEVILLDDKVTIATYFNRAEACFAFAQALLDDPWPSEVMKTTLSMDAAKVLGYSYDESTRDSWCGFGDDGDLFGSFGLTNLSTSRPCLEGETHPMMKTLLEERRRKAAIHFSWTAIHWLRLQEERYFVTHWNYSSLETKKVLDTFSRYPERTQKLVTSTLWNLREARNAYAWKNEPKTDTSTAAGTVSKEIMEKPKRFAYEKPKWRSDFVSIDELDWYYTMLEAKLMRKLGKPPSEYLSVFKKAVDTNQSFRKEMKQNPDIEPIYKLHAARMRILCLSHDSKSINSVLTLLEAYSFGESRSINLEEGPSSEKDLEDWVTERRIGIAEDILSAMQYCSDPKTASYCEFYYKAIYCKGIILAEVLKDVRGALEELGRIFRIDAAARVMDQGPDGIHRGYFYKFWSYRITETGIEPALETDRKLIRWRSKLLGLYAQLLKQTGEWRLLAAIILRLKKRMSEDLPIDGALLDDLIEAFALTSREAILQSMEKSIVTDASAFESSFRRTWDIYVDTLRLTQALRRVRVGLSRDEKNETGGEILVQSNRPRCLVAAHTVLRLEHIRWRSAVNGEQIDISAMKDLPISGTVMQLPSQLRFAYVETLTVCQGKWKPEDKIGKILVKRMEAYSSQTPQ